MYESYIPDFESASKFYLQNEGKDLVKMIQVEAEKYFQNHGITYTVEFPDGLLKFSTKAGMFVIRFEKGTPLMINIYSISNSKIKEFRDGIWETKTAFGFPVLGVTDNAGDGYFETHPSAFMVVIYPKKLQF